MSLLKLYVIVLAFQHISRVWRIYIPVFGAFKFPSLANDCTVNRIGIIKIDTGRKELTPNENEGDADGP